MNTTFWGTIAPAWVIALGAGFLWKGARRREAQARAELRRRLVDQPKDAVLAEWCRHMSLTVITVTGAVFSTTLGELQASEAPTFRTWNVPTSVTIWSDQADEALTADVRLAKATEEGL